MIENVNNKSNTHKRERKENYFILDTYNNEPDAPNLEDIIHSKEFVEYLFKLVIKYT